MVTSMANVTCAAPQTVTSGTGNLQNRHLRFEADVDADDLEVDAAFQQRADAQAEDRVADDQELGVDVIGRDLESVGQFERDADAGADLERERVARNRC